VVSWIPQNGFVGGREAGLQAGFAAHLANGGGSTEAGFQAR
jgi:hypothetical protein